jgi:hypothetical protein
MFSSVFAKIAAAGQYIRSLAFKVAYARRHPAEAPLPSIAPIEAIAVPQVAKVPRKPRVKKETLAA